MISSQYIWHVCAFLSVLNKGKHCYPQNIWGPDVLSFNLNSFLDLLFQNDSSCYILFKQLYFQTVTKTFCFYNVLGNLTYGCYMRVQ